MPVRIELSDTASLDLLRAGMNVECGEILIWATGMGLRGPFDIQISPTMCR